VCLFQSPRTRYVRSTVPPVRLKTELILPGATPLQSAFVRAPRRSPCDDRLHLPLGFVPSSRHQSKAATFVRRASHAPLRSVLRFSQPRDGFFRSRPRGPIPSRSHVQGCLRSGASLPPQPPFLIEKSLPPCRCCFAAPTHGPTFAGSPVSPRATPLGFEAFICVRPRSSSPVIHLAQGRSPLRISRSSRFSLSRRRPPLSRSPSAHSVTRSVLANISAFRLRCFETTARPRFSLLVRTRQRVDPRAVPRLRGRRYGVTSRSSSCRGHVHLSMRGSCCRDSMSRSEDRSRSTFTLRCSCPALGLATEARDCASSLKGWSRSVLAFQRSRRACLHGARARVRLSTFALTSTLGSLPSSAPTLSRETSLGVLLARSRPRRLGRAHHSRVDHARLSTLTGGTPSAHSPRAREFVSRFDEGRAPIL
jgi:hypothetical protein